MEESSKGRLYLFPRNWLEITIETQATRIAINVLPHTL